MLSAARASTTRWLRSLFSRGVRCIETLEYDAHDSQSPTYETLLGLPSQQVHLTLQYDKLGNICRKTSGVTSLDYTYQGAAGCGLAGLPGGNGGASEEMGSGLVLQHHDNNGNLTD